MAEKIINVKLKTASDTQANWESKNTTLLDGELAYDKTKKNLKIGDGTTTWNNLPYLIPEVEMPTIEISGITQELLTNGSKMGAFTSEQVAQIVKAKGFIVSDTTVGRNYYFKIQVSASGGVYVLSCESNTEPSSNDLLLCVINGTNWAAAIQLGKRFTEAIYNELKSSGEGLKIVDFPTEIDLSASFLEGQTTNGQALVEADVIKLGDDLLYKTSSGQGWSEFSTVSKSVDEDSVDYKTLYIEDGGWYNYAYKWHILNESGSSDGVEIIELSVDSSQLNGTLSSEQYALYNSKAKEQVAFKVYYDDYGYTFYLTYSHATDDNGFVYACTTADEVHTLTLYDDQYDYYFTTINNEYVEGGSSEGSWQPISFYYPDLSWEEFNVYGLEITNENYQQFLQNKKAPIIINEVLFDVSAFYDEDDGCYSVYYSAVVNNHINKINILWYPNGSSVDDCEWVIVDKNYGIPEYVLDGFSVDYVEDTVTQVDVDNIIKNKMLNVIDSENGVSSLFTLVAQYEDRLLLNSNYTIEEDYLATTSYLIAIIISKKGGGSLYCHKYVHNLEASGGSSGETSEIPTIMIRDFYSYENIDGTLESCDFEGIKKAKMCFVNAEELEEGNGMIFQVASINSADSINLSSVVTYDDGSTVAYYIYLYKNGDEVSFDCYKNITPTIIYDSSSTNYYGVEIYDDRIQLDLWSSDRYYNLDLAEILSSMQYDEGMTLYITFQSNTKALIYASGNLNVRFIRFITPNKIFETSIKGLEATARRSFPNDESFVEYETEYGDDFSRMAFYVETDEIGVCKINGTYANNEM